MITQQIINITLNYLLKDCKIHKPGDVDNIYFVYKVSDNGKLNTLVEIYPRYKELYIHKTIADFLYNYLNTTGRLNQYDVFKGMVDFIITYFEDKLGVEIERISHYL